MFTKVQGKKQTNLWKCFSENHGMLLEREGAEYINVVPDFKLKTLHWIWGRLFIMKEKSYMVIGNHYLRSWRWHFLHFLLWILIQMKSGNLQPGSRNEPIRGCGSEGSQLILPERWGPRCAMRGPWFHLPHIKEMLPSVKNGSAMAVNQPIKILRRVTFPHALASVGHAPQSWSHLSPLPLPILSLSKSSRCCDRTPRAGWVTHRHLLLMLWRLEASDQGADAWRVWLSSCVSSQGEGSFAPSSPLWGPWSHSLAPHPCALITTWCHHTD